MKQTDRQRLVPRDIKAAAAEARHTGARTTLSYGGGIFAEIDRHGRAVIYGRVPIGGGRYCKHKIGVWDPGKTAGTTISEAREHLATLIAAAPAPAREQRVPSPPRVPPSMAELKAALGTLHRHKFPAQAMALTAAMTGMTAAQLKALTWGMIDRRAGTIAMPHTGGEPWNMLPQIKAIMQRMHDRAIAEGGKPTGEAKVFDGVSPRRVSEAMAAGTGGAVHLSDYARAISIPGGMERRADELCKGLPPGMAALITAPQAGVYPAFEPGTYFHTAAICAPDVSPRLAYLAAARVQFDVSLDPGGRKRVRGVISMKFGHMIMRFIAAPPQTYRLDRAATETEARLYTESAGLPARAAADLMTLACELLADPLIRTALHAAWRTMPPPSQAA